MILSTLFGHDDNCDPLVGRCERPIDSLSSLLSFCWPYSPSSTGNQVSRQICHSLTTMVDHYSFDLNSIEWYFYYSYSIQSLQLCSVESIWYHRFHHFMWFLMWERELNWLIQIKQFQLSIQNQEMNTIIQVFINLHKKWKKFNLS